MQPDLFTSFPLRKTRVHEVSGAGAFAFAAITAAQAGGNVLWLHEAWRADTVNPTGLSAFFDPAKLLVARFKDQTQGLGVMEEALRDGAVPLVIIEISQPLSLIAGRRLLLSAQAGQTTGLCLIPQGMGSNAAETRWQCEPALNGEAAPDSGSNFVGPDSTLQHWKLTKNKSGTLGAWHVRWQTASRRLCVVPPVAQRPGSAGVPD